MALLQQWRDMAYSQTANKGDLQRLWGAYFLKEKEIYQVLLKNPEEAVKGTVKELADKYEVDIMTMVGFLDGIDESLKVPNELEELEEDSVVSLEFNKDKLYMNMVGAKADWLYDLEEWDQIFTEKEKEALYKEQKLSTTVVREGKKIGRNDLCPCGSGKKYKKCCGK
ncbi:MAG: SEC-C metal-binding domain-containing protein [Lachnospiraceae bacterium]|nr:SEC-C metal-binding domain-containing protein [Lachnospiraceae bacterium]